MKNNILSIDCGTQSLRALLFSDDGTLIAKHKIEYQPYFSAKPGWAEQNPEIFWNALVNAAKQLKDKMPAEYEKITGVGITAQRDTMINLDQNGTPLRPAITWLDQRKAPVHYQPNALMQLIYKSAGMYEALLKSQTSGKCNWIRAYQPDIWAKTYKYLQVSGYLNYKLTGDFTDSVASQIGHIPFDYKKMQWASENQIAFKLFPVEKEKLATLAAPGEMIGDVSKEASEQTLIPEGTPVIACGSDKGCETIGMGVVDTRMASLSFGTTATVQTSTEKYFEPQKFMPAYPAPLPDHYNPEIEIFRGYWMITWFKNEIGYKEVLDAEKKGVVPEIILDKLLKDAPPGAMGLTVQPYWGPGLKTPDAKGCMIGFGDVHTKGHIYRAVIEGLAFALLEGLHSIEKSGKFKVLKIAVSGGASQSDPICQIAADIFNKPLVRGKTFETSGLGAAVITSVGVGIHATFDDAIKKMVKYDRTFTPDKKNVIIYDKLYNRVYKKLYPALKDIYKNIRVITGYPEMIN